MLPIGSALDSQPPPDHPWFLSDLWDVIPVAKSQQRGTAILTLIALELYADGFMANFWLVCDAGKGVPKIPFVAQDDRGNRYESWVAGVRGGGKPNNDPARWRLGLNFAPSIAPAARSISLEMPEIQLLAWHQKDGYAITERWNGPWVFTVVLLSAKRGEMH